MNFNQGNSSVTDMDFKKQPCACQIQVYTSGQEGDNLLFGYYDGEVPMYLDS